MLALAFGFTVALSYLVVALILGRPLTARLLTGVGYVGAAGTVSAILALFARALLRQRPWTTRIAAILFLLLAGTGALTAFFAGADMAIRAHHPWDEPVQVIAMVLAITGTASLYYVLAIPALLLIPIGLPTIVLFAFLIAGRPR